MDIRLLGPLEVVDGGSRVELPSGQPRVLLTLLALHPGEALRTDRIVDALWPGSPPPSAAGVVQTYVSRLRKLLGEDAIRRSDSGYALAIDGGTRDVDEVTRLRARAREEPPEQAQATLREALSLFRGRPLADVAELDFAQPELRRLEELRTALLAERLDAELELGRHREVLPELESLVAADPLDEGMRARLMLALYRCGRQAEALDAYRDGHEALDELGLEPGQRLRQLQRAILEHDPALAAPEAAGALPGDEPPPHRRRAGRLAVVLGLVVLIGVGIAVAAAVLRGDDSSLVVRPDSVAVIDAETNRVVASIPVGRRPDRVAAGAGAVWVANAQDRTVARIDPETLTVTGSIGLGFEPTDIEAVGDHVWVVGGFDHALWRIDADGVARVKLRFEERVGPLPPGYERGPAGLATNGRSLWLAHGNEVTRLDPVTGDELGTVEAGGAWTPEFDVGTHGFVFDRADGDDAASEQGIQQFDATRLAPTRRIVTPPVSDVLVADGIAWVAVFPTDAVWQLDERLGTLVKTIAVHAPPIALAFTEGALWATCDPDEGPGSVRRADPGSGELDKVIELGHSPRGIAAAKGLLFVAVQ